MLHRAERQGPSDRDNIRSAPRPAHFVGDFFGGGQGIGRDHDLPRFGLPNPDLRPEDVIEKEVPVVLGKRQVVALVQNQDRVDAEHPRRGRGLHAPIGLQARPGHDDVRFLLQHVGDDEFEFPGFVPAEGQPGQVLPLDIDLRTAELGRQFRQLADRRRTLNEADPRKPADYFFELMDGHRILPIRDDAFPGRRNGSAAARQIPCGQSLRPFAPSL